MSNINSNKHTHELSTINSGHVNKPNSMGSFKRINVSQYSRISSAFNGRTNPVLIGSPSSDNYTPLKSELLSPKVKKLLQPTEKKNLLSLKIQQQKEIDKSIFNMNLGNTKDKESCEKKEVLSEVSFHEDIQLQNEDKFEGISLGKVSDFKTLNQEDFRASRSDFVDSENTSQIQSNLNKNFKDNVDLKAEAIINPKSKLIRKNKNKIVSESQTKLHAQNGGNSINRNLLSTHYLDNQSVDINFEFINNLNVKFFKR